jgi:hypothetical protein
MNVFTTDHPLNSGSEDKKPGLRSYFFGVLLAASILCPFFAIGFWLSDITDNGNSTGGYTPAAFWVDFLAAAVVSFFVAFVGACMLMLLVLLFRKLNSMEKYYFRRF